MSISFQVSSYFVMTAQYYIMWIYKHVNKFFKVASLFLFINNAIGNTSVSRFLYVQFFLQNKLLEVEFLGQRIHVL